MRPFITKDEVEGEECEHASVMPSFDEEAARGKSSTEVRKMWPRFFGICPDCGQQYILYASYSHYLMGDW